MKGACDSWQGLAPEKTRFMTGSPVRAERRVTWKMLLRFLGGYTEPRWWRDHRPQPLRSRVVVQHFRTHLRREAVTRLRIEGASFRAIGRELGISQVAAWKLWQQTVEDAIEQNLAEREGQRILAEACRRLGHGEPDPFRFLFRLTAGRFGTRVATKFLGRSE
jgi:hypothetical protein